MYKPNFLCDSMEYVCMADIINIKHIVCNVEILHFWLTFATHWLIFQKYYDDD